MEQKPKRKPKNPIHFQIQLTGEQAQAKQTILENKITVLRGKAGTGKTAVSAIAALDLLFTREVERIVITRPTVTAGEEIGFMPGNIDSKLAPFMAPLLESMYSIYGAERIDGLVQEGRVEIIPVAFMRGRNLKNCAIVIDEAANITNKQMELLLGRFCKGSKMIICGDARQCDLKDPKQSGFEFMCDSLRLIKDCAVVTLQENHRDEVVEDILKVYEARK